MTGGFGFIGKSVCSQLLKKGFQVIVITRKNRKNPPLPCRAITWSSWEKNPDLLRDEKIDGAIHLSGESVIQRWTPSAKKKIHSSRILLTRKFIELLKRQKTPLSFYIGASAVGFYGDRSENLHKEDSPSGDDFLAKVCVDWEKEHQKLSSISRVVILRVGVVLGEKGGILKRLQPFLRWGILGPIGKGEFFMSWIAIKDLVKMIFWSIENKNAKGVFNAVSPNPCLFRDFIKTFCRVNGKSVFFPIPKLALRVFYGKGAGVIYATQKVFPQKALDEGFRFEKASLEEALTI